MGIECQDDTVLQESICLFRGLSFYGLGYLEMKRDERSGKYFIIEPNIGRPTAQSAIAEAGGVDLVYTMYCDSVGLPLPISAKQKYTHIKWIYLRRDIQSAFHYWKQGKLTFREWWRSLQGKKTYALFSWNDPGPFIGDLQRSIRLFMSSQERRKRDYRSPL